MRTARNALCSPMMSSPSLGHIRSSSKTEARRRDDYGRGNGCEENDVAGFMCNGKRHANNIAEDKILVKRTCSENPAAKVRKCIISKRRQKPDKSEYDAYPLILLRSS